MTSHLAAMRFAPRARAVGLNDVGNWRRLKAGPLARFGVTPPSRNRPVTKMRRGICAGLSAGEIVIFDKACVDCVHLGERAARGVQWVTGAEHNLRYRVPVRT